MVTMEGNKTSQTGTLRTILLWAAEGMKVTADSAGQEKKRRTSTLCVLLQGLGLGFRMQALVALAQRLAGLALRENVLNLGFAARKIAVSRYP